ncbi:MAG: NTP transferase domain-containing protein [Bacteroidota bacterium]
MKNTPELYALILAGGKSTRMGTDKGLLEYHGMPQRDYLYRIAETVCQKSFLSVRSEQQSNIPQSFNLIVDQDVHKGPFNGMLSAHQRFPDVAWLVLACDLPLLDSDALKLLQSNRNHHKMATAFATKQSGLPEPLIAIWEPQGLKSAVTYLKTARGSCPRKFLINSDITLVHPAHDEVLYNANSLEERDFAHSKLSRA